MREAYIFSTRVVNRLDEVDESGSITPADAYSCGEKGSGVASTEGSAPDCSPEETMSEAAAKKYCQNCQHCFVPPSGLAYSRCLKAFGSSYNEHYIAKELDIAEKRNEYCTTARVSDGLCGPDAKWFQHIGESILPLSEAISEPRALA